MLFYRKNWPSLVVAAVCAALVPGLVFAQQNFSGVSKRLQGLEARILGELAIVINARKSLTADYNEIHHAFDKNGMLESPVADKTAVHAFYEPLDCGPNDLMVWKSSGGGWDCAGEHDPLVKDFAKNNLPACTSVQGLTNNTATTLKCVNFPAAIKGDKPDHQWSSYSVRFETDYGVWGSYENLRGPKGATGVCP